MLTIYINFDSVGFRCRLPKIVLLLISPTRPHPLKDSWNKVGSIYEALLYNL
jgi:hypothetical protein